MAAVVGSRWWRRLAAAVMVTVAGSCSAAQPAPLAHPLAVSAQPFALAEVARRVGLGRVVVSNTGGLMVTAGTAGAPWLDPQAMQAVTAHVAAQLSAADPGGRRAYQEAATVYEAQLASLEIDYQSSLADCGRHDIVTADHGFAAVGAQFGFTDHAATDPGVAGLIRAKGLPVVFTEAGVPTAAALALAQATHTQVGLLATLTVLTPEEQAAGATYLSLMTDNLAALSSALDCAAPA
jgi:ABC-type Zn uptake system ZnuABC Zn-binding protein ZnuA